jgi:hypothetical protein
MRTGNVIETTGLSTRPYPPHPGRAVCFARCYSYGMKRETLNVIIVAQVVSILGLLMLLAASSRLTDFDYLAERYQSLISGGPNSVRRTLETLSR